MQKIVLTGGGSAGHVTPNLALLPSLRALCDVVYIGTDGIERRLLQNTGVPFYTVKAPKLVRGSLFANLALPVRFALSLRAARRALRAIRPAAVFSKGGYAALPVAWAAASLHIPVVTHESDLSPGLANKLIARRARAALTSFPETAAKLPRGRYAGSPVRPELLRADRAAALRKYGFSGGKPVLLCFGGGSGSAALNAALEGALPALLPRFDVLHLCGKAGASDKNKSALSAKDGYVRLEFERDMASAYAAADLALARAGSNTVFELLALKKPSLLVPLENKRTRGDQVENALYFQRRGLVRVLRERDLSPAVLPAALNDLADDGALRAALQAGAFRSGNAAIVQELQKYLR